MRARKVLTHSLHTRAPHSGHWAALATVLLALVVPVTATGQGNPPPAEKAPPGASIMLLFDSSGSMRVDDGSGKSRIDRAKEAIGALIDSSPPSARIGLRVFGGRVPDSDKRRGCQDSRVIFPIGRLDAPAAKRSLESYRPLGFTPIGLSLRRAAQDLGSQGRRTIILVSDGQETCGPPEPCEVAREIAKKGVELKIQTIGFQVGRKSRRQLECIARAGNGVYRDVQDAPRLAQELRALSIRALRDYRARGRPVQGGPEARRATEIGPGQYVGRIRPDEERWFSVELGERETVQAATTLVPLDRFKKDAVGADYSLQIVTPRFEEASANNAGAQTSSLFVSDSEGGVDSIGVSGRPVGVTDAKGGTTVEEDFARPGRYYLRLKLEDNSSKDLFNKIGPDGVPFELLVNVLGRKGGQAPPPAQAGADPGRPSSGPGDGAGQEGPSTPLLALVAGGTLALGLAAGVAVAARRRRTA